MNDPFAAWLAPLFDADAINAAKARAVIEFMDCPPKRYADWLAVFRQAVREDWLKVWRVMPDGSNVLTTVGEQLRRAA